MSNQLNIFSWSTDKLAEAWQHLADFNFADSELLLNELLEQDPTNEEAAAVQEIRKHWHKVFDELKTVDPLLAPAFLLEEIEKANFEREWGSMLLKDSLKKYVIRLAEKSAIFQINEKISLADLYAQHHLYEEAEKILTDYVSKNSKDAFQIARLADMQYEQSKVSEAAQNYMTAMLLDASKISLEKTRNKKIAGVIRNYGPEMAAAWSWLYGENVPLNLSTQFMYSPDPKQKKVAKACYLILMAEKARTEGNANERVEFRKKLHDAEPLLYQAYFNFCNTGKFLSADEL